MFPVRSDSRSNIIPRWLKSQFSAHTIYLLIIYFLINVIIMLSSPTLTSCGSADKNTMKPISFPIPNIHVTKPDQDLPKLLPPIVPNFTDSGNPNTYRPYNNVFFVQIAIHTRKPVYNPGFNLLHINQNSYTLGEVTWPRRCNRRKTHCPLFDFVHYAPKLLDLPYKYFYIMEDDVYFCGTFSMIEEIAHHYQKAMVSTSIGAGATLYRRDALQIAMKVWDKYDAAGVDLLSSINPWLAHNAWSMSVMLASHLYEGSARGSAHGTLKNTYPGCFEYNCVSGQFPYSYYNLTCLPTQIYHGDFHTCTDMSSSPNIMTTGYFGPWCESHKMTEKTVKF